MSDTIEVSSTSNTTPPLSPEQKKQNQIAFVNSINYARLSKTIVQDLINNRKESVIFSKYPKEKVIEFLSKPQQCEKQIRNMSIFLYANSSQYRRLCNYFSKLATLNYTLTPYNLSTNYNKNSFLVNYQKVVNLLQKFNLKSQLPRIFNICMYSDVFYGLYFETSDSFDIIQLNPDYCRVSSKEDGCLVYSLDMDFFSTRQYLLDSYGEELKTMYYAYSGYQEIANGKKGKKVKGNPDLRWQEPPNQICIKVNDDQLLYALPPFAAIFPDVLNLEDYKLLKKTGEVLDRYKILSLQIPLDDEGGFQLDKEICDNYYNNICDNVSDNIGVIQTPLKLDSISFQNTTTAENNAVKEAEEELFSSAGSSINLFGGQNSSSSSLNISIRNDESITYSLLRQIENWVNKYIKKMNLPYDFKLQFLNQSIYSEDDVCKRYKEAATYGIAGSRSLYAASLGLSPSDILGMQELEDVLDFNNKWIPLKSSSTMASEVDDGGRPTNASKNKTLTDSGQQTQDDDENDSK